MKFRLCTFFLLSIFSYEEIHSQDFGNALHFDGTNDYVALPAGTSFNTQNFTFEAWVKWEGPSNSAWQRLIDFGSGTNNYMFFTPNYGAGKPRFAIRTASVSEQIIDGNVSLADGNWHHIAITLDDPTNTGTMYIDGIVAGSNNAVTLRPLDLGSTPNNWLGRSQFGADPYFKGTVDDIKIWNAVRTQIQIQNNYNQLVGNETGLISYYKLNSGTAEGANSGITTLTSSTTNVLNGTLTNFALTGSTSNWVKSFIAISNSSFTENFDNGTNGWTSDGTNNTWAFGTPAKSIINSAHSGTKAWVTGGLTSTYGNNENNWVQSPSYNFLSATAPPTVSLWIWRDLESDWDGVVLQQSISNGSWTTVGILNDPNNWYNQNLNNGYGANWSGASTGWVNASHELGNDVIGQSNVRFRLLFRSDVSVVFNGFAFDDFTVTAPPPPIGEEVAAMGNCLDFDGVDDYVYAPTNSLSGKTSFTFETWVYWRGGVDLQRIINVGCSNGNETTIIMDAGRPSLRIGGYPGTNTPVDIIIGSVIPTNQWVHVAATFDGATKRGTILINGTSVGSKIFTVVPSLNSCTTIGRMAWPNDNKYFNGTLDEVRFWGTAKSELSIRSNMFKTLRGTETGLLYIYSFNQGEAGKNNSSIISASDTGPSATPGELFAFALNGNSSNFIESKIGYGAFSVFSIEPNGSIPGKEIKIYGNGFGSSNASTKIFIGDRKVDVLQTANQYIKARIPETFSKTGSLPIVVSNNNGSSRKLLYPVLYEGSDYDFKFNLTQIGGGLQGAEAGDNGDIDGDGLIDIVTGAFDRLSWFRNLGGGNFSARTDIGVTNVHRRIVKIVDIDDDGDLDILTGRNGALSWYRNTNGAGSFSAEIQIYDAVGGNVTGIDAGDLDGNGTLDIVGGVRESGTATVNGVFWFSNDGSENFTKNNLVNISKDATGVHVTDLDNDNDLDVISANSNPSGAVNQQIAAHFNNGSGVFVRQDLTLMNDSQPTYFEAVDVTGNGFPDILAFSYGGSFLIKNNGNGTFLNQVNLPLYAWNGVSADVEGDGDMDIFVGGRDRQFYLLKNDGLGNLSTQIFGLATITGFNAVTSADFDNDGDMDVVTISASDAVARLFKNVKTENDLISFSVFNQINVASLNFVNHTVDINVPNNMLLNAIVPTFEASFASTVKVGNQIQSSGSSSQSFIVGSVPTAVTYTVVADDGTPQNWIVTLHPVPAKTTANTISASTQTSATVTWTNGTFTDSNLLDVSKDNFATFVTGFNALGVTGASFAITGLTSGTAYQVRIKGKNAYGESQEFSNVLTFTTIPAAPVLNPLANIGQTSGTASWQKVTGATSYLVDVSKDNFSTFIQPYNAFEVSSSNVAFTGLAEGTEYQIRVRSVNTSGASVNSTPSSFATIPSNPLAVAATLITATSFTANWNPVTGAYSYKVELSADNFSTISSTNLVASGNSFSFTDLSSGNFYSYRARAINSTGLSSGNSNVIALATLPLAPSLDPVTAITQTTATLNWQAVVGATNFQLDLSKDNFSTFIQPYNNYNVSTNNFQLIDLNPGTTYQFRVRSSNASGTAPNFSISSFITIPSNPVSKAPYLVTSTSFIANWDAVANPNVSSYTIELSNNNFTSILKSESVTSGISYEFIGLTSGTPYSIRVRAKNANSLSSGNSNIVNVMTTPIPPTLESVSNVGQTTALVKWPPVTGAGIYRVDISKDNFSTFVAPYNGFESPTTSITLSGLSSGTTYTVRVRAVNSGGSSAPSDAKEFITIPPEPIAKEATAKTSTTFTANWDVATTATSYTIELSDNNFTSILKSNISGNKSVNFNGLTLGKSYAYRIRATNTSGTSGNSNAILVVPSYSVTITNESFEANTKTASVTAISSAGIDSVKLFHRGIASGSFKSVNVPLKSGTTYDIAITTVMQDEMGTEYYFVVKDGLGDKRNGAISYSYKQVTATDKLQIPFTHSGRGAANYNFFSVPYQLIDPAIQSVFEPALGSYQNTKWRLIRYQDGRNVDYGEGLNKLEPGQGYWFASLDKVDISISSASVVTANRTLPYSLNLQRGWNQIGNPLPFDVSWADVLAQNTDIAGVSKLFVFDAGSFKKGDLKLWGGGFVKSERDVSLKMPVTVKRTSSGRVSDSEINNQDISQPIWMVPLTIEQGELVNDLGAIGMHLNASLSNDEFDEQSLPRFINYLELNSYHPEYFMPRFMRDIVPPVNHYNWSYMVESNYDDAHAELKWDNLSLGNNSAQLLLYDAEGRQFVDMKKFGSYQFDFSGKRDLKFFYAIDKEHFSPDISGVGQAFPNPFDEYTSIPLIVATENTGVSCTVYDAIGKPIKTILSNQMKPGYHEIQWDGSDGAGLKVSTGLYIYRISFGNSPSQTGKVILK